VILGIISDVHANVLALEAALDALRKRGADTVICLGDLVGYGPSPNETLDLIRSAGVICTLGAADERIAFDFAGKHRPRKGVADQILQWTREVMKPDHIEFLRTLPVQQRLETPVGRLRFFHGGPDTPEQRTNLDQDPVSLARMLEENRCRIIAAGNTHVPFYRQVTNGWVVNPGSVGLALNGEPGADYAVLTIRDGTLELHMDKVEYDFAAVAFDIIAWGLPPVVAEAVQRGRMPATDARATSETGN
jgi:putative phosphoesterase